QAAAPEETSDEAIVARALHDRQAFGLLYDRYVDPVYRYCYGRLGSREEAEDATSLIFARALAALPTHRGGSFRSWLFAIAHNVVLNARRDAPRHHQLAIVVELADPGPRPDEMAEAAERRRSVSEALALLPEEQRRIVELRLAGLTGPEVAAALGRSHDSVRTTQRRALARLRTLLGITPDAPCATEGCHAS
ncbi:MAG: transcriptional regulator, LuxR family, partial [Thermomicrobiales bacterium]|nr:transcriptional regulator, LuxR family [Thermomicrobiales bacterium]